MSNMWRGTIKLEDINSKEDLQEFDVGFTDKKIYELVKRNAKRQLYLASMTQIKDKAKREKSHCK